MELLEFRHRLSRSTRPPFRLAAEGHRERGLALLRHEYELWKMSANPDHAHSPPEGRPQACFKH